MSADAEEHGVEAHQKNFCGPFAGRTLFFPTVQGREPSVGELKTWLPLLPSAL